MTDGFYQLTMNDLWMGRQDNDCPERFHQLVVCEDLADAKLMDTGSGAIALIGFAVDEGVARNQGRVGAAAGPIAIRKALANLSLPATVSAGDTVTALEASIIDFGDIICPQGRLDDAQAALAEAVAKLKSLNYFPIVLGGGHETAWGHFQGLSRSAQASQGLSIVNFDAHLDMRPIPDDGVGTSGTPFTQAWKHCQSQALPFRYTCIGVQPAATTVSLLKTAVDAEVNMIFAEDIMHSDGAHMQQAIDTVLGDGLPIYVTFCLDVLAAASAPGVSAPQALGLAPHVFAPALKKVFSQGNVFGFDVVELAPKYDQDQRTAIIAANLVRDVIGLVVTNG